MLPVETVHIENTIPRESPRRLNLIHSGIGFTHVGWGLLVLAEMVFKGPTLSLAHAG